MRRFKGIRRAFLTVLMTALGLSVGQAAAALQAGQREQAITLLTQAGNTPVEEAVRHGRAYSYAVLDVRENGWLLNGCP